MVELARALGQHPAVYRVDLLTRLIKDPKVSSRADPLCTQLWSECLPGQGAAQCTWVSCRWFVCLCLGGPSAAMNRRQHGK